MFQTKPGKIATIIGVEAQAIRDAAPPDGQRTALLLDLSGAATVETMVCCILDDLASVLVELWPDWPERAAADKMVSKSWLRAAVKRAASGVSPRFPRLPVVAECRQLLHAVDPSGPILVASLDRLHAKQAAPAISVLEWCAGLGAAVVLVFSTRPQPVPPYDRILYGAVEIIRPVEPLGNRLVVPSKAHPNSSVERRVERALQSDAELKNLFVGNRTIAIGAMSANPCVDFLWEAGRVVVELDGPEHRSSSHYAHDRHRDYELLVAGYLVLRLTNEEVAMDLQRTIEKIRDVVHFRRSLGAGILA